MKKLKGRFWALCLAVTLLITGMPLWAFATETEDVYPYIIFAGKDISCSGNVMNVNGNLHANRAIIYQCLNGIVNGTSSSAVATHGANSHVTTRNELTEQSSQPMIYVGSKLLENYFSEETKVEIFSRMDSNLNLAGNTYSKTYVSVGGNVNLNGVAIGAENNIEIGTQKVGQSYNVNANRAVLYSAKGDIIIDVDNFNFNGLIYAPNGNVEISSDGNIGVQGVIIAQHVTLQGGNLNLQSDTTTARFVADMMGESDNSENIPNKDNTEDGSEETSEDTSEDVSEDTTEDSPKDPIEDDSEETTEDNSQEPTEEPSEEVPETEYADTDGDGLIDEIEEEIGTNPNKADSDGDNLSDFDEIYLTGTNPIKTDTDDDGISDDKEDADEDKLNTLEEIRAGTLPTYADTDCDGLLDGEEGSYATDPLDIDTDDDGLWDGDEIAIGLNPCNPATFGIPDAEYTMLQTIDADSAVLSDVNVTENAYDLQIDAKVSGNLEAHLIAEETGYRAVIANDSMVGMPIELTYDENCQVEEVTLSFAVKEAYRANEISYFSDANDTENYSRELVGIKRLQVFKYFEEDNMLLPIETFHDEETNTVKTVVDEFGVYCLIDMEKWILSLAEQGGVMEQPAVMSLDVDSITNDVYFSPEDTQSGYMEEIVEEESEVDVIEEIENSEESAEVENIEEIEASEEISELEEISLLRSTPVTRSNGDVIQKDIVFILSIMGTNKDTFDYQVKTIKEVSDYVLDADYKYDVRVCVILQGIDSAEFLGEEVWYTNYSEIGMALDDLVYYKTNLWCNRGRAFDLLLDEVEFRTSAVKYVYWSSNGYSRIEDNCASQLTLCKERNVIYSEIQSRNYEYFDDPFGVAVYKAIQESGGKVFLASSSCCVEVVEHLEKEVDLGLTEFNAVVATGWKKIVLADTLNAVNEVDTDNDSLLDWDEVDVNNKLITVNRDGTVELPTIEACLEKHQKVYVQEGMDRLLGAEGIPTNVAEEVLALIMQYRIMPINSDPTSEDSDRDGLQDYVDDKPLCYDYIPNEFLRYISSGYIELSDLRRASDGFTICMKPLGDIMNELGITAEGYKQIEIKIGEKTFYYDEYNGMNANTYYLSDWYLYGFIDKQGETVYSIIKMRTCENNLDKDPGVSIPFREFNIKLLTGEYDYEDLGAELHALIYMDDEQYHFNIQHYFANEKNETNYFLADIYVELILAQDNINNKFIVLESSHPRVFERLEESSIYDNKTHTITINNIDLLSLDEKQCLLASRAGTISYNAFAAEIIAHADGTMFLYPIKPLYINSSKADLGANEGNGIKDKIAACFFAYEHSPYLVEQRRIFGEL